MLRQIPSVKRTRFSSTLGEALAGLPARDLMSLSATTAETSESIHYFAQRLEVARVKADNLVGKYERND